MFRAVPLRSSARSTAAQSGLFATPFAHQRYATRLPRASTSGAHRFLRSGFSRPRSNGTWGTRTSRCEGLVATWDRGLSRTAAVTSSAERTVTGEINPSLEASAFSMRVRTLPRPLVGNEKTTLPLLSNVRTSRNPSPSNTARRSAIATRLPVPALLTPRSNAMYVTDSRAIIFPSRRCRGLDRLSGCQHNGMISRECGELAASSCYAAPDPSDDPLSTSTILPITPPFPSNSCACLASARGNRCAMSGLILCC